MNPSHLRNKPTHSLSDYSGHQFSESERRYLRKMMDDERHETWFWATIRRWAFWGVTMLAGIIAAKEQLKTLFGWFTK